MKSIRKAIEILEKAAWELEIEKRMWEKQPESKEIVAKCEEEKQDVLTGLEILKANRKG